jgi:hypothetical protein
MRDVVNKNVTEEQLMETAERVFSRGWGKMKLYFMIGLPTETDEDVRETVLTGARAAQVGRKAAKGRADVTVSVSVHVPKPHTPFQWCAMDSLSEVARKQQLLRETVRPHRASPSARTTPRPASSRASSRAAIAPSPTCSSARGGTARASTPGTSGSSSTSGRRPSSTSGSIAAATSARSPDGAPAVGPHRRRPGRRLPRDGIQEGVSAEPPLPAVRQGGGHVRAPHEHRGRRRRHAQARLLRLRRRLRHDPDAHRAHHVPREARSRRRSTSSCERSSSRAASRSCARR